MAPAGRRVAGVVTFVAAGLCAACTASNSAPPPHTRTPARTKPAISRPAPPGATLPAALSCPKRYAAPDPKRPHMKLAFTVSGDLTTVTGRERIDFTPDLPISELVFRLTANSVPIVAEGNRILITSAVADHGGKKFRFSRADAAASTQGGLLRIPFGAKVAAGTRVHADIGFRLTLGAKAVDRIGRFGRYAYFGSGEPLLAWQRGYGWHTEDMLRFAGESTTSEAMDVDLAVTAPAQDTVIASGDPADPAQAPAGTGTRTWHAHIGTARDVSVAVGPFAVTDASVHGVKLRVGAPTAADGKRLLPQFRHAISALAKRFGPYPFASLSVARVPGRGGGIEYPSSILLQEDGAVLHETAHQWFYAMVGNSQALHPWLDESFAQYASFLVEGDVGYRVHLDAPGQLGASSESYFLAVSDYVDTIYTKGPSVLLAARRAAGPAKWDTAVRCYVARNAWRIATPADFEAAIRHLPDAVAVLRVGGAFK